MQLLELSLQSLNLGHILVGCWHIGDDVELLEHVCRKTAMWLVSLLFLMSAAVVGNGHEQVQQWNTFDLMEHLWLKTLKSVSAQPWKRLVIGLRALWPGVIGHMSHMGYVGEMPWRMRRYVY